MCAPLNRKVPCGDASQRYHVEPREDAFVFWHNGEYPVYLVGEQLCRASDECEPPTRYKVEFIPDACFASLHSLKKVLLFSLVGFERNQSLLDIFIFLPGALSKWKHRHCLTEMQQAG